MGIEKGYTCPVEMRAVDLFPIQFRADLPPVTERRR
jgi:hypothetical protein